MKNFRNWMKIVLGCIFLGAILSGCNKDPQCHEMTVALTESSSLTQAQIDMVNNIAQKFSYNFTATRAEAKDKFAEWAAETETGLRSSVLLIIQDKVEFELRLKDCESGRTIKKKVITLDPNR